MAEFGGWEMPISYANGTISEHQACRDRAAAFDVSHLGTLRVSGSGAFDALQTAFTNDLRRIAPGRAQYTHLLDPMDGSVLDDIIVWWHPEVEGNEPTFDVMPNASNTGRVVEALTGGADALTGGAEAGPDSVRLKDITSSRAVVAVQGPLARALVSGPYPELAAVPRFGVVEVDLGGFTAVAAGTGYTGEDGFEVAVPAGHAATVWDALTAAGVEPAGLGARDTLRLEAGLPLHGHELGPGITPWQANLGWVVRLEKGEFRGKQALLDERDRGVARKLLGLRLDGRQPAREGSVVRNGNGDVVGVVTSGNFSPTLGYAIAFALINTATVEVGDRVGCDVRGRTLTASVVKPPFLPKK